MEKTLEPLDDTYSPQDGLNSCETHHSSSSPDGGYRFTPAILRPKRHEGETRQTLHAKRGEVRLDMKYYIRTYHDGQQIIGGGVWKAETNKAVRIDVSISELSICNLAPGLDIISS